MIWIRSSFSADTSNAIAPWATQVRHEFNISETRATRVRQEGCTNNTSATREKKTNFDNYISGNIFSHPYISYMAMERLQREEQFHSKNYFLEMPCSYVKMRLKNKPRKMNIVMVKAISKGYTLDCSCKCSSTFPHSYV